MKHQAEQAAHKLSGSLGMFGSDQGSRIAQQLEKLFQITTPQFRTAQLKKLTQLTENLQQSIHQMDGRSGLFEDEDPEPLSQVEARVLVVDDDDTILLSLQKLLAPWGLQVIVLNDSTRFLEVLEATAPDLVILDEEMPAFHGTELCRMTRNLAQGQYLPILFLTAHNDPETLDRIFSAGAADFVSKPLVAPELMVRVVHRLDQARLMRDRSGIDPLTGIANRYQSSQALMKLLQRPFCFIAVLTVLQLKQINLNRGHAIGDQILSEFAQLLQTTLPESAILGRWAGAEFVVGFSEVDQQAVESYLDRVSLLLQQSVTILNEVRYCVGLAQYPQDGQNLQRLYQAAIARLTAMDGTLHLNN